MGSTLLEFPYQQLQVVTASAWQGAAEGLPEFRGSLAQLEQFIVPLKALGK